MAPVVGATRVAATPATTSGRPRHSKPDPRPSRLIVAATTVAALSVIASGLVRFPTAGSVQVGVAVVPAARAAKAPATSRKVRVTRPVRYVHLRPGQKAPPGAKVIQAAAPAPRVIVRRVSVPQVTTAAPRRVVTRTRQSGR